MDAKYVIGDVIGKFGFIIMTPFIFHPAIDHKTFCNNIRCQKIHSAGFVKIYGDDAIFCYGKSISLGVESRHEEDSEIIERLLKGD